MLPGVSGFRPMPRKMAGIATITIDASIVAIVMLSVVLDSAIHRYRSGFPPFGRDSPDAPFRCPESRLCRTLTQSTARHLLNGNYLSGPTLPGLADSGDRLFVAGAGRGGGGGALEYVVHGDQADDHERGDGVEERHHDGDRVDEPAADEPPARCPVLLGRQRLVYPLAVQRPLEDRAEAGRHAEEYPGVQHHRDRRVVVGNGQVVSHGGGGERDRHHEQQQHEVQEQQRPVHRLYGPDQRVVVDPDDADGEEADQVGDEGRPFVVELVDQAPVSRPGHGEIEREQRDRHGDDAVAERFEPGPVHLAPAAYASAAPVAPTAPSVPAPPLGRPAAAAITSAISCWSAVSCAARCFWISTASCSTASASS